MTGFFLLRSGNVASLSKCTACFCISHDQQISRLLTIFHRFHYTFSTRISVTLTGTGARLSSTGGPRGALYIDLPPWWCVGRARSRGVMRRAREGMQKVRSPCRSADLRETPAVPEFAQWRSAFTRCLASASSLS